MRARTLLLSAIILGTAAAPVEGQDPGSASGSVSGRVLGTFESEVRPLAFALVEVWAPGMRRSVVADSLGRYLFEGVPVGAARLRVTHAGHAPTTIEMLVPAGEPLLIDVHLRARPVELPPMDVTTDVTVPDPDPRDPLSQDLARLDAAALEVGSGFVDAGLTDAVRAMAGNDPTDADDVLFMRGSTTDLKLVLLDGAPVYTPFHVAGLLRSFEPSVLGRADLHVGGAPARYDGGLTYILDLRTRRPRRDRMHASGTLDLLSASAAFDVPLGDRAALMASARSLHDLGAAPLGASPYGYHDVLATVEVEPSPGHLLRGTTFWNRESVALDLNALSGRTGSPVDAWWANGAVSTAYLGRVGDLRVDVTLAGSRYEASLPLQPPSETGQPEPEPFLATARTQRLRGSFEVAQPTSWGVVRGGVTGESLDAAYRTGPGASDVSSHDNAGALGVFLDVTRLVGSDVTLRGGVRADGFSEAEGLRLAPRATLSWALTDQAILTVATGRYHQRARATDEAVERSLSEVSAGSEAVNGARQLLPVATADHVVVSLDQMLSGDVALGLAGFWKGYQGLDPSSPDIVRSSGVDLRVRKHGETATAWLGYGLSWFWSDSDLAGSATDFTGRQLLTAGLSGRLPQGFGAEIQVAYGAGLPYTSVPFRTSAAEGAQDPLTPQNGLDSEGARAFAEGLDEDFLRVDLELHARFRPTWRGRTWEIQPYLRILNALDRRDALFYAFQPWRDNALTPLVERPLVPVIGVSWSF